MSIQSAFDKLSPKFGFLQVGMDVSHHGGACYVDDLDLEQSNGNGVDAHTAGKLDHLAKKSPNELESEVLS